VDRSTVRQWKANGVVPEEPPYVLADVFWNYRHRDEILRARNQSGRKVHSESGDDPKDLAIAKLQQEVEVLKEKHRESKRRNDEEEGELIPADETEREIIAWAVKLRNELLQLPVTLSNLVPAELKAQTKTIVTDELRRILKQTVESPVTTKGGAVDEMILNEAKRVRTKQI